LTGTREGYCSHMNAKLDPLVVDRHFFTSLIEANLLALDQVLAGDFILIDVMSGSEVTKSSLLAVIGSGKSGSNRLNLATISCASIRRLPSSRVAPG